MMADGSSAVQQGDGVVGGFAGWADEDFVIDLDMLVGILDEPTATGESQQEDAQNSLLLTGSGDQVNFQNPASADVSPTAYDIDFQPGHVGGETDSSVVPGDPWMMDNSGFGLVCDGVLVDNGNGVPGHENGIGQPTNMMTLGDASVPFPTEIPSTSSLSHNSDVSSDLDGFYQDSAYLPQYSGEFESDTLLSSEGITIDEMDEMGMFSTDSFEPSGVTGFKSEDNHGIKQESQPNFKFGSYVYDGVHEGTSLRPCSVTSEPRSSGKPPVSSVRPKLSTSNFAPGTVSSNNWIKAEIDKRYSSGAPGSSDFLDISFPTSTRPLNSNLQDQPFGVQTYSNINNHLRSAHDRVVSQKTYMRFPGIRAYSTINNPLQSLHNGVNSHQAVASHFSRVSPESTHSNSSGSRSIVDDDPDLCILEDISQPPRLSQSQPYQKPTGSLHPVSYSDSYHYAGAGSRQRICDERVLFRAALQDLNQPKAEANPPDGHMAIPLMRHQRIALSWMAQKETSGFNCSGGILADDQGLGKTISTIALILKERAPCGGVNVKAVKKEEFETLDLDEDDEDADAKEIKKESSTCETMPNRNATNHRSPSKGRPAAGTLIVCPTSVLRQWAEELQKKVTAKANLSVIVYHGSNRTKDPQELAEVDVVLTTYSIVSMEVPKKPFADEGDEENARAKNDDGPMLGSSGKKRKYPPALGKKDSKKQETDRALFEALARPLAKVAWFRVVLDEAQSIKNHKTQVARACWGLRAKRRWCLSGTPLQNTIDDLYSYFRFLRYDPYTVYTAFCNGIKGPIQRNPVKGYKKLQAVLKTVMLRRTKGTMIDGEPIIILPPKSIELKRVEFSDEERCFYSRLESDSRAQFKEYAAAGTVKQNYVNILLMLLRLRQACDHPLLVRGYESVALGKSSTELAMALPHEKRLSLLNCLEASLAICALCNDPPEDAVVSVCGHVFCNQCISEHLNGDDNQCPTPLCKTRLNASSVFSKAVLDSSCPDQRSLVVSAPDTKGEVNSHAEGDKYDSSKIKAAVSVLQSLSKPKLENSINNGNGSGKVSGEKPEKAIVFSQWTRMLDLLESCLKTSSIQYRRLDGTMSVAARERAVRDFNTLPEVTVIIMSLKAASLGLNMVAACHVILLDLWWNPTTEDQAIDRAHRIGQTRPVTVLRLTVKNTVEDRILALQQKKRQMVASAFGEDGEGGQQTRLTEEDLKYLFMG